MARALWYIKPSLAIAPLCVECLVYASCICLIYGFHARLLSFLVFPFFFSL